TTNMVYLKKILYGALAAADRSVELILNNATSAPRPDKPVNLRSGFRQQLDRRVVAIEVRASDELVTRYELAYTQDPDNTRSRLATVQRIGNDLAAAVPPWVFEYSERASTSGFATELTMFPFNSTSCLVIGGPDIGPDYGVLGALADFNRDGL